MNLEAAWAVEEVRDGDQIVFGRVRIRARDAADGTYRIVHPYGTDEFTATGGEGIDMTDDIGIAPGAFGGALQSRIGPFLVWDTFGAATGAPPAGYIGDPGVEHAHQGQPVRPGLRRGPATRPRERQLPAHRPHRPLRGPGPSGRERRRRRPAGHLPQGGDGTTVVEVFATSEAGESIKMVAPRLGYRSSALEEDAYEVATSADEQPPGRPVLRPLRPEVRGGGHRRRGRHEDRHPERRRRARHQQDDARSRTSSRCPGPRTTAPPSWSRPHRATPRPV